VPDDRAATRHPAMGAVFAPQAVLTREHRRVSGPRRLDLADQFCLVVWMDSLKPILRRTADFMVFATGEGNPSRREMNPVGFQTPVPECLAVAASTFRTAGAGARAVSIHGGHRGIVPNRFGSDPRGREDCIVGRKCRRIA